DFGDFGPSAGVAKSRTLSATPPSRGTSTSQECLMTSLEESQQAPTAEAFAERLFMATLGAMEVSSVYVGERLGWYASLATDGPATSEELAARTQPLERYAREWLEGQAVLGILTTDPTEPADERRYELPAAMAEVLTDVHSLNYLGSLPRAFAAVGKQMP